MEMMIVLLIMSIIAAATAPIVSKKMSKNASSSNSNPWVFIDTKGNAAFNMAGKDVTAVIGASKVPTGVSTRLYIDCGDSNSQLTFGKGDEVMQVTADPAGRVGISNATIPNNSIALGSNQTLGSSNIVAIGSNAKTSETYSVAVGSDAQAGSGSTALNSAEATGKMSVALGNGAKATGENSFAMGQATASKSDAISIGRNANASGQSSVAIGAQINNSKNTLSSGTCSVAVGSGAQATDLGAIAIGDNVIASATSTIAIGYTTPLFETKATGMNAIAIGEGAQATNFKSMALGSSAKANHEYSTAIGNSAQTTNSNQIVLGNSSSTVYIPGNLVVDGGTILGRTRNRVILYGTAKQKFAEFAGAYGGDSVFEGREGWGSATVGNFTVEGWVVHSDRRLKNLGKKYTTGLEELKKLDFYHYTFKKDETKTPHVGVIAQDLQKVFPDAVTKGEDGFLRIRMEDMFYAVINAVKELACDITSVKSEIKDLKAQNAELKAQNAELIKRIEKLEKSKKY